jgi:hypothetical protein
MSSICLRIQVLFCSPIGAIPPVKIEVFLLGITLSIFTSLTVPNPLQLVQAPFGELNENELGSGFG